MPAMVPRVDHSPSRLEMDPSMTATPNPEAVRQAVEWLDNRISGCPLLPENGTAEQFHGALLAALGANKELSRALRWALEELEHVATLTTGEYERTDDCGHNYAGIRDQAAALLDALGSGDTT